MINFFHTYIPEPIAFQIGPLSIHWYGVILVVAILAGYWIVNRLSRSSGLNQEAISSIYVNTLIIGFIGARLYHVISDWGFYGKHLNQIFAVWNGGLAIHGAIIGAVLSVLYFSRKYKINFWKILDIFAIAGILGQAIGRWGNYFNQELFGAPTDSWIGIPIDVAHRAEGFVQYTHFHPAFLYESLLCLAVFIILCVVFKKQTTTPLSWQERLRGGLVFWLYIGLYSFVRIIVESIRVNDAALVAGIRLPLLVSVLLALLSIAMILKSLAFYHKKE